MNNRARGLLVALVLVLITPATHADVFSSVCLQGDNSAACIAADAPGGSPIAPAPAPENDTSLTSALRNGPVPPIGAKVTSISFCSDEASPGNYRCGRVPMGEGETKGTSPGPQPAGWSGQNSPPSTAATTSGYTYCYAGSGSASCANTTCTGSNQTQPAACAGQLACAATGKGGYASSYPAAGDGYIYTIKCTNGQDLSLSHAAVTYCPSGYALSGSTCNLSENATNGYAKWSSDGKCSMTRTGHNAWEDSKRDPDCSTNGGTKDSAANLPQGVTRNTDKAGFTGTGSNGNKTSLGGDSTGKGADSETRANSDGKTSTQSDLETVVDGNGDSKVTGETQKQINGTGTKTDPNTPPSGGTSGGGATEGTLQGVLGTLNAIKSDIEATTGGLAYTHTGTPGHDPIDKDQEITAARSALTGEIATIKTEAAAMFASGLEAGAYTCGEPLHIESLNASINICFSAYTQQLQMIGAGLVFAAYVVALFIILG